MSDLDEAFKAIDGPPVAADGNGGSTRQLLPAGQYVGAISSAEVREGFRPWVKEELSLRIVVEDDGPHGGQTTFCDLEIAPLTSKDGAISEGKMRYLKWQLTDVLGYDGKLSDLAARADELIGLQVSFEQKVSLADRINPNTGQPYENREVTLKANLGRASTPHAKPAPQQAVEEDDDIPF